MRAIQLLAWALMASALWVGSVSADPGPGLPLPSETPDLSTPRRAIRYFLTNAERREWLEAARVLDLRDHPNERQVERGVAVAEQLATVLLARGVTPEELPDQPRPRGQLAIEVAQVPGSAQPIEMKQVSSGDGHAWVFNRATVRAVPEMAARIDRGPIGNAMPGWLLAPRVGGLEPWQALGLVIALVLAAVLATLIGRALSRGIPRLVASSRRELAQRVIARVRAPFRLALVLALVGSFGPLLRIPEQPIAVLGRIYVALWLIAAGWLGFRIVDLIAEQVARRADGDGYHGRMVRTRVMVLRRVLHFVGVVVLSSILLLQFDSLRELGVSILASAGVAGIVIGLAAQRAIGNLLAGIQLSFTQPLRIGDKVVVEGEFGTVEEINLSYVVIQIWDQRRLIVPMTKLLESPFQNWKRSLSQLLGAVTMPIDFSAPIRRIRADIESFVRAHPLFDGTAFAVQVVDASERTATLRVLASASDAGAAWDLRCAIREWLLQYLQQLDGGRYLPRIRLDEEPHRSANGASEPRALVPNR